MERRDKVNYYLDIAQTVTERATCLRRIWGAVIVKMMKLFQQVIMVHLEDEKIALI